MPVKAWRSSRKAVSRADNGRPPLSETVRADMAESSIEGPNGSKPLILKQEGAQVASNKTGDAFRASAKVPLTRECTGAQPR